MSFTQSSLLKIWNVRNMIRDFPVEKWRKTQELALSIEKVQSRGSVQAPKRVCETFSVK